MTYLEYLDRCKHFGFKPISLEEWNDQTEAIAVDEAIQDDDRDADERNFEED